MMSQPYHFQDPFLVLADEIAALHAVMVALAALHHRNRTGEGQHARPVRSQEQATHRTVERHPLCAESVVPGS